MNSEIVEETSLEILIKTQITDWLTQKGATQEEINTFFYYNNSNYDRKEFHNGDKDKNYQNYKTSLEYRIKFKIHLRSIGVPEDKIEQFLLLNHSLRTLSKLEMPSKEEWEDSKKLPKDLKTLREIRLPLLCNWTIDELISNLKPYVLKEVDRFNTQRCDIQDCKQQGALGIVLALKTDAGIAPFACHAFSRIKTSVRRSSAESGIIKEPEKRPSKPEVRLNITYWLMGTLLQKKMEEKKNKLNYKLANDKITQEQYDSLIAKIACTTKEKKYINTENLLEHVDINSPEMKEQVAKHIENHDELITLRNGDLIYEEVQRTSKWKRSINGKNEHINKNAHEWMIRQNYPINKLNEEQLDKFLNYLKHTYFIEKLEKQKNKKDKEIIKIAYKKTKSLQDSKESFVDVASIVNYIAIPPDFHNNPTSMDMPFSEDGDKHSIISDEGHIKNGKSAKTVNPAHKAEDESHREFVRNLLSTSKEIVRSNLSEKQLVVCDALFGDKPISGSELAKNFGELSGEKDFSKVSRQRIAQYQASIRKKWIDAMFNVVCESGKYVRIFNNAKSLAGLTVAEDAVFMFHLGLNNGPLHEFEFIAENFEWLTRCHIDESWFDDHKDNTASREKYVQLIFESAKVKMMEAVTRFY